MYRTNTISKNLYKGNISAISIHNTQKGQIYKITNFTKGIRQSSRLNYYANDFNCYKPSTLYTLSNKF